MSTLTGHGLTVALPAKWEGRIYLRDTAPASRFAHVAGRGHPGERAHPVLHVANFPLPPGRGDFGTGAVERMSHAHVFASLFEYDGEEAGRALFGARGLPVLHLRDFATNALQRRLAGQLGVQRFFTVDGRPFCLYAVLGSSRNGAALVGELRSVLATLRIEAR